MRTFRSAIDKRPPEAFRIEFELEITEKVEVPGGGGGTPRYEERGTGQYTWESREFSARHGALSAGMTMAINDMDPSDPMAGVRQNKAIKAAIRAGVVEHEAFMDLINDTRAKIAPDVLTGVLNYLVELSAARPTGAPSS